MADHKTRITEDAATESAEQVDAQVMSAEDAATRAIQEWRPVQDDEVAYGVSMSSDMPEEIYRKMMAMVDEYIKSDAKLIGKMLNRVISVCGCMIHQAEVSVGDRAVFDADGVQQEYVTKDRTILRVCAVDGKDLPEPVYISFVSMAIARDFKKRYIPRYGIYHWKESVRFEISQVPTKMGHTYNVKFVG